MLQMDKVNNIQNITKKYSEVKRLKYQINDIMF